MIFRGTPQEISALRVGDILWNFDGNRRTYGPGFGGGPIYEKHFRQETIVGETKVSWLVGPSKVKVNKKTLESALHYADRGYFTKSGMEADIWMSENKHKIVRAVGDTAEIDQLKEIARIIGYRASRAET